MRKLIINNQIADLSPDESIEIQRHCSLFDFSQIQGSYSIQFKLPYSNSARNKVIFNFSGEVEAQNKYEEQPFSFEYKGADIAKGVLVATQSDNDLTANMFLENAQFNDQIRDKKLSELELGFVSLDTSKLIYTDNDLLAFAQIRCDSQYNDLYLAYDAEDDIRVQMIRKSNVLSGSTIQTCEDDYNDGDNYYNYSNCPQIFLKTLLSKIFEQHGIKMTDSFFDLEEFQNIAMQSQYDINTYGVIQIYPPLMGRKIEEFLPISQILPESSIKDFLLGVLGFFCAGFDFDGDKVSVVLLSDLITSTESELLPNSFRIVGVVPSDNDGYELKFDAPSEDSFYQNFKILEDEKVDDTLDIDLDSYYRFGKGGYLLFDFAEDIDFYLSTSDANLYARGEALPELKGVESVLAKPKLETNATDLQPIFSSARTFKHTVKFAGFGNRIREDQALFTLANNAYTKKTFKDFRFGYVVPNDYDVACSLHSKNDFLNLHDWQTEQGGTSFLGRCWTPFLKWLEYRKEIEAEISGADAFLFLRSYRASKKYRDQDGNKFFITQVSEVYLSDKISTIKIKGYTVY